MKDGPTYYARFIVTLFANRTDPIRFADPRRSLLDRCVVSIRDRAMRLENKRKGGTRASKVGKLKEHHQKYLAHF